MDTAIDMEVILVEVIGGYRQRYIEKNGPRLVIAFNLGLSCSILTFNIHIQLFFLSAFNFQLLDKKYDLISQVSQTHNASFLFEDSLSPQF